ncbi:DNA phosphorothioation-dependent restriction protein DptG [Paenibacillus sp. sgz500958]|uniref:DNA phosphorothioation-dependent restriction protein DptG n=1 Tax=Paenibacillus sp. sgz500958 TaxID=3242475 RepID=UPI0036D2BC51
MAIEMNLSELEKAYKKKHETPGQVRNILPFVTTLGRELKDDFNDLMGEYVRQFCKHTIKEQQKKIDEIEFEDPLIAKLTSQIDFRNEAQLDLERFLRQFLFGANHDMKVFHPYIYNFLPVPEKENYRKFSKFIADVLVGENSEVVAVFKDKQSEDILTELILNNLEVKSHENKSKGSYQNLLPFLSALYQDDLLFISKHRDYFLSHFSLLTHFYSFMYLCQISYKFEQFVLGDFSQASQFYFALEWEPLSKRRKSTEELGFKGIKDKLHRLFVHLHTLSQLSMQSIEERELPFLTYPDLNKQFTDDNEKSIFINSLNDWITKYSSIFPSEEEDHYKPKVEIDQAMKGLFEKVRKGVNREAAERYGKNIQAFGGKTFIKSRSSLGQVFNMNQSMLLLLTAICVRDTRMPLNSLFNEFARRGVVFDRLSKKAIIDLYDSLNILDKKSDSGDAQYVKPIL